MAIIKVYRKNYSKTSMLNSILRLEIENGNTVKLYSNEGGLYERYIESLDQIIDYEDEKKDEYVSYKQWLRNLEASKEALPEFPEDEDEDDFDDININDIEARSA